MSVDKIVPMTFARCLIALTMACGATYAQWINYPTAGVPKGKDGKPNLSAPTPRAQNGRPDLSGMWLNTDGGPCPKLLQDDRGECLEKTTLSRFSADLTRAVPGGLPLSEWGVETKKKRINEVDPHAHCLPSNFPRMLTHPHITKFIQTPGVLVLMNEFNGNYRQIFTDGRPLPVDPQPSWHGYSVAKWQGDVLVVETTGFRDDLWMDMSGTPLTSAAKVIERYRRPNFGTLEVDVTVDDPKAYTRPWNMKLVENFALDTELLDEYCLENEQSAQHMSGSK